jgi:hypothetical protein
MHIYIIYTETLLLRGSTLFKSPYILVKMIPTFLFYNGSHRSCLLKSSTEGSKVHFKRSSLNHFQPMVILSQKKGYVLLSLSTLFHICLLSILSNLRNVTRLMPVNE